MNVFFREEFHAKAYIKQKVILNLSTIFKRNELECMEFKAEFVPNAQNVVACSNKQQDIELAEHLKYLLESNKNGNAEQIEIIGLIYVHEKHLHRPQQGHNIKTLLHAIVRGNFARILQEIHPSKSRYHYNGFILHFNFAFEGRQPRDFNSVTYFDRFGENFLGPPMSFPFNAESWDILFGNGRINPQVTLAFGTKSDSLEWTTRQLPFIFPKGRDYCLPPVLKDVVESRSQEIESGKGLDVVIVGDTGRQWTVCQDFIVDSSDVFQAMLETKGFEEEKTKQIKLPEIKDELIEELIKYMTFYDMNAIFQDVGIAIDLLEIAERYQINKLKFSIETMLLKRSNEDFETGQVLKLFAYTKNLLHFKDLSKKVIEVLKERCAELQDSEELCDFFQEEPKTAQELFQLALVIIKDSPK